MIDALALLPLEDVIEGMRYLKTVIPPEAEELLMYSDRTYVSGSLQQPVAMPSDALVPLIMRHTSPMFAPHLWNVHDATMNNNARTNNICEGWNNKFFNLVGHYHPSIWRVIEWFQLEEAIVSTIIKQDAVGNPPQRRRSTPSSRGGTRAPQWTTAVNQLRSVSAQRSPGENGRV
ncbi:hypothetical protein Hamer_G005427 [Homarus americanus]|uniref:Uncharacterized protein n=1 Tax=Homarus americanus TaxID=6706 RepID=A0A8J5K9X0_HOMAM|nr:hypothetical protein Hamer_G005427 [Homarus americanus]